MSKRAFLLVVAVLCLLTSGVWADRSLGQTMRNYWCHDIIRSCADSSCYVKERGFSCYPPQLSDSYMQIGVMYVPCWNVPTDVRCPRRSAIGMVCSRDYYTKSDDKLCDVFVCDEKDMDGTCIFPSPYRPVEADD